MNTIDYIKEAMEIDEQYLYEMAVINPRSCKNKTIQVEVEQRDEGMVPHMHVYHNKNRNPKECSYIRLDKIAYSPHHELYKLPKKLKQQFIEVMNEYCPNSYMTDIDGNVLKATGYQTAVQIWADTFEDGDLSKFDIDENGLIKQLDYSKLE